MAGITLSIKLTKLIFGISIILNTVATPQQINAAIILY